MMFGPNVMRDKHKDPNATDEVIKIAPDEHSRLFHAVDLDKFDDNRFVHIVERIK